MTVGTFVIRSWSDPSPDVIVWRGDLRRALEASGGKQGGLIDPSTFDVKANGPTLAVEIDLTVLTHLPATFSFALNANSEIFVDEPTSLGFADAGGDTCPASAQSLPTLSRSQAEPASAPLPVGSSPGQSPSVVAPSSPAAVPPPSKLNVSSGPSSRFDALFNQIVATSKNPPADTDSYNQCIATGEQETISVLNSDMPDVAINSVQLPARAEVSTIAVDRLGSSQDLKPLASTNLDSARTWIVNDPVQLRIQCGAQG